jgi:hypothetical protein
MPSVSPFFLTGSLVESAVAAHPSDGDKISVMAVGSQVSGFAVASVSHFHTELAMERQVLVAQQSVYSFCSN